MLLRRRDFALFWILTNNRKVFRRSGTAGFQTGEAVGCFGEYPPDRRGPEIENDFERESDASTQPQKDAPLVMTDDWSYNFHDALPKSDVSRHGVPLPLWNS